MSKEKPTPEEFAYFIYNMPTEESEEFFKRTKSILKEKSNQEIEEIKVQLREIEKALDESISRRKKLNRLSKKM